MSKEPSFAWAISHDPLVVPLILNLERTRKVLHAREREIWNKHGITPSEFDVLATLRCSENSCDLTPGQIQERVLITSGGLTKVIQLLEKKQYVKRSVAKEDNRIKPVQLTPAGRQFVAKVMRDLADMTGAWLRSMLKEGEIIQVAQVLGKVCEADHG